MFLSKLEAICCTVPVAPRQEGRRAAERLFFCDAEGWLVAAVKAAMIDTGFKDVTVSPWCRFLRYRNAGMLLKPHVDYQWLPGYISSKQLGYFPKGADTTHSFLLYLTDCENGGETLLLEHMQQLKSEC